MSTDRFAPEYTYKKHLLRGEEQHKDVYKNFFQQKNIVLSGHNILTWGSDISHGISVLRIKQKLPTKIYCGANINTSGKVTFGRIEAYYVHEHTFKHDPLPIFSDDSAKKISLFLETFLTRHQYTGGVDIDLLSEIPSGHGFASSSTISVLLSYLVYILVGKLDPKILQAQELSLQSELFEEIYDLSRELSNCISGGRSVGASNYAVMTEDMPFPIVHFSQKSDRSSIQGGNIMNDDNTDIYIPIHRTLYKDSLFHFFGIDTPISGELPIDYGIIYTGFPYRFGDITETRHQERIDRKLILEQMQKSILGLNIHENDRRILMDFFEKYEYDSLSSEIDEINIKILNGFRRVFESQDREYAVGKCIEILQKVGLMSFSFQKQNKLFLSFQHFFYGSREFEDEEIAILPFNSGKVGGSLLFVMRKGKSRLTLEKVIEKLKTDGYMVSLDYASWIDGYAQGGIRIEQYISEKIYSSYTREGDILFTDSLGRSYSGEYNYIIKNETDGILLDTIGGRIYIQGVKLTSKEIHSQNTTIDMLRILMEHIGEEVSNTRLPISTYSQNKNEILGKVVIPIRKLALKHFGAELSLTCSGGITEYYLRLDTDQSIPIGILNKLSH